MQYYFFSTPDRSTAYSFKQFAIKQNIAIASILSDTIILLCILLSISRLFVNFSNYVANANEYRQAAAFLLASSVAYRLSVLILKKKIVKKTLNIYWILSSCYALAVVSGFMWFTFAAQHNPRNTMTMFMIGMFGVAFLWILDLMGTISITVITLGLFTFCLRRFQVDHGVLIQSYIAATLVLALFFVISRVLYSYHFRYYTQVKTIEEKNKEISRIYSNQSDALNMVAHDLRSPLNSITALIEILKYPETTEQEREEYYNMILKSCKDADHTIYDLMDAARKIENKMMERESILLNNFLESIHEQWKHRLPAEKKLVLNNSKTDIFALINRQKLQRVLDNLISNALKFTPNDGIIKLELRDDNDKIRISISDNGIGIPEKMQPYIFDRFTKAGRTGVAGEKSYGLGLNICQQIVEQHEGTITVQSIEAEGTTFHIDLPICNN